MREVAMLISNFEIPLATFFGTSVTADFHFFDYAKDIQQQYPGLIKRMVHTHPAGAAWMSEEDRTTLKAWTMAFAPYKITLEVICFDSNGDLFRTEYWYELEPLEAWLKGDKKKQRDCKLHERKLDGTQPQWVWDILLLSSVDLKRKALKEITYETD